MTRQEIIDLADAVRGYQETHYELGHWEKSEPYLIDVLIQFCAGHSEGKFSPSKFLARVRREE